MSGATMNIDEMFGYQEPGVGFCVVSNDDRAGVVAGWLTAEEAEAWVASTEGRYMQRTGYRVLLINPASMIVASREEGTA